MRPIALIAIFLSSAALQGSAALAADLAAYRAYYTLEPQRIDASSSQIPLDGAIAYEVRGSDCAGYALDSRFATRYASGTSGDRVIDTQSTTFETPDGLQFEVKQQQKVNNAIADDQRISVKRPSAADAAAGTMKGTKDVSFTLGAQSLFPTIYEKRLLAAAAAGKSRDDSVIYDGSDGEKQYRAITFIGKKREPGNAPANSAAAPLAGLASWTISIGYYSMTDTAAETPEFQANFDMYENGVTTAMVFDYGTYALKAHLDKLELLPNETCSGQAPKISPLQPDAQDSGKLQ